MKGFSLIELMIVVAIVSILASVAIPSYQSHVRDTRRADGGAVLMQARQAMERYYSKNYTYVGATLGAAAGDTFSNQAPIDGGTVYYNLTLDAATATTFQITAAAAGAQASDECGSLAINQAGQKGAKGALPAATSSADVQQCWR